MISIRYEQGTRGIDNHDVVESNGGDHAAFALYEGVADTNQYGFAFLGGFV